MKSAIAAVTFACAGCAAPQLTREQWIAATTRTLDSATKEEVIAAAERVLRLADGDDFVIVHTDAGFQATRRWSIFVVIAAENGTDHWTFEARESGGSVKASVTVSKVSGGTMGVSPTTSPGIYSTMTVPGSGALVNGPAAYELFWERVNYLLGRQTAWPTCSIADARAQAGRTWGDNSVLCNAFNVKDLMPDGKPSKAEYTAPGSAGGYIQR